MDYMAWILFKPASQAQKLKYLIPADNADVNGITSEIYDCWLRLFDLCKFELHNFDQGMKAAWTKPRYPISGSINKIQQMTLDLIRYYHRRDGQTPLQAAHIKTNALH